MADIIRQVADKMPDADRVWARVRREAEEAGRREPALATFLFSSILSHHTLEEAVTARVASRLDHADMPATIIRHAYHEALSADPAIGSAMRTDIFAVLERDPATDRMLDPVLYFKGFHALQAYRLAHWLWRQGRADFALYIQSRASSEFQVDIHPMAQLGRGVFIDHATGVVIGSTAVVADEVSILQGVTLGGTGKESGDRHPKIGKGVLIGAGAKILGNIEVGHHSRVAAGSVVLHPVPPCTTVAGVPARVVGTAGCDDPAMSMYQMLKSAE